MFLLAALILFLIKMYGSLKYDMLPASNETISCVGNSEGAI